jgi:endonuclease/exonuclease/phosphatase (EEP) superfamily protein YafD
VQVVTTHLIPFRRFGIDPLSSETRELLNDIQMKLQSISKNALIQGDFNLNYESLREILPEVFSNGLDEIIQTVPTTPKGRRYDHILFRGLRLKSSLTDSTVRTDHFPVIMNFDL